MKEWKGVLPQTETYQLSRWCSPEQALLMDIETTGFSPASTMLYLIGLCQYREGRWQYRMLFNDDGRSEYQILETFLDILTADTVFFQFNGDKFDLPYLAEKCRQYSELGRPLASAERLKGCASIDLYKVLQPFRKGLNLPDLKLTTIEAAMGVRRQDTLTGGDLIPVYRNYIRHSGKPEEQKLFQHNYEDILAMVPLLKLLSFRAFEELEPEVTHIQAKDNSYELTVPLTCPLPLPYQATTEYYTCTAYGCQAAYHVPIIEEELKYFLPKWRDYYYLPMEDTAVHKSIGSYVDSQYREPARKETCFLKRKARFLPWPRTLSGEGIHLFRRSYKDSLCFAQITEVKPEQLRFWQDYLCSCPKPFYKKTNT